MSLTRLGQANAAGDNRALFLKVFAGEVLTAFTQTTVMNGRHRVRTISSGKSASFPATWLTEAEYLTPGDEITGKGDIRHNERIITIDDLLIAHQRIYQLDEAMNHYDVRSEYSKQMGNALARKYDQNVLVTAIRAARDTTKLFGNDAIDATKLGGKTLTDASYETDGEVLASGIFDANVELDGKDVPDEGRSCLLPSLQYSLLAQTTKVINKDWGGAGVYADGSVLRIGGTEIVKVKHFPNSNLGVYADNNTGGHYLGDFSNTVGLVMTPQAVGTVKLLDLAMESEYQINYQATLMVAKYAVGHGVLRPECAVEIAKS
jgi:hypothetical protein